MFSLFKGRYPDLSGRWILTIFSKPLSLRQLPLKEERVGKKESGFFALLRMMENYSKMNFLISFFTSLYFGYKLSTTFQNLSEWFFWTKWAHSWAATYWIYFCGKWTSCKFKTISCLDEHCHQRALIFLIVKDL